MLAQWDDKGTEVHCCNSPMRLMSKHVHLHSVSVTRALENYLAATKEPVLFVIWWQQKYCGYKYIKEIEGINYGPCDMLTVTEFCPSVCGLHFMYNAATCWKKRWSDSCWNTLYIANKRRCVTSLWISRKCAELCVLLLRYRHVGKQLRLNINC